MALTDLITSFQASKDKVGGIKEINIWEQLDSSWAAATAAKGTVGTSKVTSFVAPTTAGNVGNYKFAQGTGKMDVSMTQEKGLALCTISIEGYIPNLTKTEFTALSELRGKCLMAQVITNAKYGAAGARVQNNLLVGWDNVLGAQETGDYLHSDFGLFLESIEGSTGAEMGDGTGVTVKLTAVQGELPYATEA